MGHTGKCFRGNCLSNLKFLGQEHDMPCALEKILIVEISEHVEYYPLTTIWTFNTIDVYWLLMLTFIGFL